MSEQGKGAREGFWHRPLAGRKVRRVLKSLGVDLALFQRSYEADTSRAPRSRELTRAQIEAVARFLQDGDVDRLKETLGVKSDSAALRMVGLVKRVGDSS